MWMLLFVTTVACLVSQVPPAVSKDVGCSGKAESCAKHRDFIKNRIQNFDFKTGCRSYKRAMDCLRKVFVDANLCNVNHDSSAFESVTEILFSATGGMCGLDGSVSGCAYDFQSCMDEADVIERSLTEDNRTETCLTYIKFSDCVQLILDHKHCPVRVENNLSKTKRQLRQKLEYECFKTCREALDLCVADVPVHMTFDPSMTEEDQELLCAELETATACLNTTDLRVACEKDENESGWRKKIDEQRATYDKFCSLPARTCHLKLDSCSDDLHQREVTNLTDAVADCKAQESLLDCFNRTSSSEFCRGKLGAQMLALRLEEQTRVRDFACSAGVCYWIFPKCYQLLFETRVKAEGGHETLSSKDLDSALKCANDMGQDETCRVIKFSSNNITFANTVQVLADLKISLYASEINRTVDLVGNGSSCEQVLPKCFLALAQVDNEPPSCEKAEWRKNCAKNLTLSPDCTESEHFSIFANILEKESHYLQEFCRSATQEIYDTAIRNETSCGQVFPKCFLALTRVDREPPSCKKADWRKTCAEEMVLSRSCRESGYSRKFIYIQATESLYLQHYCSAAQSLCPRLTVLLLTTLLVSHSLNRR